MAVRLRRLVDQTIQHDLYFVIRVGIQLRALVGLFLTGREIRLLFH